MADLSFPDNPQDPGVMDAWCDRVEKHFLENDQPHGVAAAQRIRAAMHDDDIDTEKFEEIMGEASVQILKASLLESRDAYAKLIEPVERERRKHGEGSAEYKSFGHALDTYRIVVKLFTDAATALDDPSPAGRQQMETAVEKAKARLATLKS